MKRGAAWKLRGFSRYCQRTSILPHAMWTVTVHRSLVERQPHVVLREARRGRARVDDVVELRALQPALEAVVLREAVEHRGHPPREALDAPDPPEARPRVGGEKILRARREIFRDRARKHAHVRDRRVEAL